MTLTGLLGGTFDPVHNGHLGIARDLCAALDFREVRFILNAVPPHRTLPQCPVEHRLAMLEAALAGDRRLVPDTRELDRRGPSYTLWTLRSLRRDFPESSLCWIVGADAWLGLESWHRWQELSSLAHFVVVQRPGWEIPAARSARLSRSPVVLERHTAGAGVLYEGPEFDVSATEARSEIAAGHDASDSLPDPVWKYIQRNKLYGYH